MTLKHYSFPQDPIEYLSPTWQELSELTYQLSQQILAGGHQIDRVVTLARGGWTMARALVDWLQVSDVASIGVKFHKGVGERYAQPEVYQDLPVAVKNERILIFDDVADSGESLKFALRYLHERGVLNVVSTTLFYKPKSVIKPDYYAFETQDWVIFPYEVRESRVTLSERWQGLGVTQNEIQKRLQTLNLELGLS